MVKKIASLSPEGFVEAIADKANRSLMYFYLSQYSQTLLYRGNVRPLAWLIQQYGNDPESIRSEMESVLQAYFTRNFDYAVVSVTQETEKDVIKLRLAIIVRDGGKEYGLGHVIRSSNARVLDIFDINNNGYILPNHGNTVIS